MPKNRRKLHRKHSASQQKVVKRCHPACERLTISFVANASDRHSIVALNYITTFTYLVHLPGWVGFPSTKRQSGKDRIGRGNGNPAQKTRQFLMTLDTSLTVQVVLNWNDVSPCYTAVYKFDLTFVGPSYTKASYL